MTNQLANFLLKKPIVAQVVKLFPLLLLNVRINYRHGSFTPRYFVIRFKNIPPVYV
jgi:hypothetical protein